MKGIFLLDTNVVSDGSKISPSEKLKQKLDSFCDFCKISSITWYELQRGLKRMSESKKKIYLSSYVQEKIEKLYEILPYDKNCAEIQSAISVKLESVGKTSPYQDTQIAAVALANNLVLVTRNVKDFASIQEYFPLKIENWFE